MQGLGGAVVSAVALSLIVTLVTEPSERAKAMGVFGFVASAGGSIGAARRILTDTLNWHWIFLVNVPIGIGHAPRSSCCRARRPASPAASTSPRGHRDRLADDRRVRHRQRERGRVDDGRTLGLLAAAAALMGLFLLIESRVRSPLVPLALFRLRNVAVSNVVGVLWAAAMFAWFFLSALYLQLVLGQPAAGRARFPSRQ